MKIKTGFLVAGIFLIAGCDAPPAVAPRKPVALDPVAVLQDFVATPFSAKTKTLFLWPIGVQADLTEAVIRNSLEMDTLQLKIAGANQERDFVEARFAASGPPVLSAVQMEIAFQDLQGQPGIDQFLEPVIQRGLKSDWDRFLVLGKQVQGWSDEYTALVQSVFSRVDGQELGGEIRLEADATGEGRVTIERLNLGQLEKEVSWINAPAAYISRGGVWTVELDGPHFHMSLRLARVPELEGAGIQVVYKGQVTVHWDSSICGGNLNACLRRGVIKLEG